MHASRISLRLFPAVLAAVVSCGGAALRSDAAPALALTVSCPASAVAGEPFGVSIEVSAIGGELTEGYPFRLRVESGEPVELGPRDALRPEADRIVFAWSSSFDAVGSQTVSGVVRGSVCTETRCVEIEEPFSCSLVIQ